MNHIKAIDSDTKSVCGKELGLNFYFKSIEAAVYNGLHDSNVSACRHCTEILINVLSSGMEKS